ncbi:Inositol-pentakisphosphate 2-kinase [Mortierella sp. GBA30]|nr:Inositol-pentakisphosphate 2-kinase [Mortierella sp. GBA30]
MATITELYQAEHWRYRAEGNANMVLQYSGPDPRFATTMLRLRKIERKIDRGMPGSSDTDTPRMTDAGHLTIKHDISKESRFASKVIGLLLGQEFVEQLIPIALPAEFLKALAEAVESARPESRMHKGIDSSQTVGFLALDHTQFLTKHSNHPSVAVEIKPKWGFLSKSNFIRKDHEIKKRKCRFCMYQHHKINAGQEQTLSEYCPINLFSTSKLLVHDSLDALAQTPQNNLRLFVNGKQQPVNSGAMFQILAEPSMERIERQDNPSRTIQPTTLTDVLTNVLIESPLLKRLGRLQQALDSLDVETIHRFYDTLANPTTSPLPEPTLDEFLNTAEVFLERTDMDDMMEEDQETFEKHNEASIGFGPDDNPDEVPDSLKMHYIREFLLSATLKDCSIMITIRRDDHEDQATRELYTQKIPRAKDEELVFHERTHRIQVNGEWFVYKITCIDLDPKKIVSVPMYLNKDRIIVDHYLAVVGDREPSCGL